MDKLVDRVMKLQSYNKTLTEDNQKLQKIIDDTLQTLEEYKIDKKKKEHLINLLKGEEYGSK